MNSGPIAIAPWSIVERRRRARCAARGSCSPTATIDEVGQLALLERVLRVEAQAPDVARDDEHVDLAGLRRRHRHHRDHRASTADRAAGARSPRRAPGPRPRPRRSPSRRGSRTRCVVTWKWLKNCSNRDLLGEHVLVVDVDLADHLAPRRRLDGRSRGGISARDARARGSTASRSSRSRAMRGRTALGDRVALGARLGFAGGGRGRRRRGRRVGSACADGADAARRAAQRRRGDPRPARTRDRHARCVSDGAHRATAARRAVTSGDASARAGAQARRPRSRAGSCRDRGRA